MASRSQIDKAGFVLSDIDREYDETALELDYVFEDYRKQHLEPLTRLTLELQSWLQSYDRQYFVAQRLKRKPQILRKLRRLSVRLTQLQDIGGCRIIVEKNSDVDDLVRFIAIRITESGFAKIVRSTDYRDLGRDDTGYRAYHIMLDLSGYKIELQLRSRIQHYWSESIERTSVIYGFRLKEKEGDPVVVDYFKAFSDALHSIEVDHSLARSSEITLQSKRLLAEAVVSQASNLSALGGHVNSDIVRAMAEREGHNPGQLNNWILVFDWNDGNFVSWDVVGRNTDEAIKEYIRYEREFPEEDKYEVVMIGSSDISTVPQTHSHYFGIEHHTQALEGMESSIIGLTMRNTLDVGSRRILLTLKRRKYWGKNTISVATLKNHFCQGIAGFDPSLQKLIAMGLVIGNDPVSLDVRKANEISLFA
jgi:ppGpp synthetase/RelA/SpoT-type nucleotidyltranferase